MLVDTMRIASILPPFGGIGSIFTRLGKVREHSAPWRKEKGPTHHRRRRFTLRAFRNLLTNL